MESQLAGDETGTDRELWISVSYGSIAAFGEVDVYGAGLVILNLRFHRCEAGHRHVSDLD